jgi:aminopeptidase N
MKKARSFCVISNRPSAARRSNRFLQSYFNHFAFQSITTDQFVAYLKQKPAEFKSCPGRKSSIDEWINQPGLPASAPQPTSTAFTRVEEQARLWLRGELTAAKIPAAAWTTQEWLHFLKTVQDEVSVPTSREGDGSRRPIAWSSWTRLST